MAALSHVKAVTIADFTGTVTVFNSAGNTTTANATDIVRPSDWGSVHNFFNTISGNTLGSSTAIGTNLVFGATGGVSASHSTAAGAATMWISAPGTSSLSATGQVSISVNASTISIGVPDQLTRSGWNPYHDLPADHRQIGQGTLAFDPMYAPNAQFDRLVFGIHASNTSNSSGSHTLSFWFGIYTRNVSSLSLLGSTSISTAVTHSGTAGSYSLYSAARIMTVGSTSTLSGGQYWMAALSRTTSGGANASYSQLCGSNQASNLLGFFGSSHATTVQFTLGQGVYSATTSGMPASVAFSQIRGSDSMAFRPVIVMLASGTV